MLLIEPKYVQYVWVFRMMKSITLVWIFMTVWSTASAQQDSSQNLQLWDHYSALFDSTQTIESFHQHLFQFSKMLESKKPVDTAEMIWDLGESMQITFEDSLSFHYGSSWSWSGSWRTSSKELFIRGKPFYEQSFFNDMMLNDTTTLTFQFDSEAEPDTLSASGELYNFWLGTKLSYTYHFVPAEEATYVYNRYPSKIVLHPYQKIVGILKVAYEPIDPNHRLKWYFENSLYDK